MKTKQLAGAQDKLLSAIMSEMDMIKDGGKSIISLDNSFQIVVKIIKLTPAVIFYVSFWDISYRKMLKSKCFQNMTEK